MLTWNAIFPRMLSRTSGITSIPLKPTRNESVACMPPGVTRQFLHMHNTRGQTFDMSLTTPQAFLPQRPTSAAAHGKSYHLDHLQFLETEAIHVMREVAAEFERPCLMFSGGKDSICLLRLAEKAFRPSEMPMPLLNIDNGHHFPELIEFSDRLASALVARLFV